MKAAEEPQMKTAKDAEYAEEPQMKTAEDAEYAEEIN